MRILTCGLDLFVLLFKAYKLLMGWEEINGCHLRNAKLFRRIEHSGSRLRKM